MSGVDLATIGGGRHARIKRRSSAGGGRFAKRRLIENGVRVMSVVEWRVEVPGFFSRLVRWLGWFLLAVPTWVMSLISGTGFADLPRSPAEPRIPEDPDDPIQLGDLVVRSDKDPRHMRISGRRVSLFKDRAEVDAGFSTAILDLEAMEVVNARPCSDRDGRRLGRSRWRLVVNDQGRETVFTGEWLALAYCGLLGSWPEPGEEWQTWAPSA